MRSSGGRWRFFATAAKRRCCWGDLIKQKWSWIKRNMVPCPCRAMRWFHEIRRHPLDFFFFGKKNPPPPRHQARALEKGGGTAKTTRFCVYTEGAIPRPSRVVHWSWVFIPKKFYACLEKKSNVKPPKKIDATQTPPKNRPTTSQREQHR